MEPTNGDLMVTELANEEGCEEIRIFIHAKKFWTGKDYSESEIEKEYGNYLKTGKVPAYIRAYFRHYQENRL